MFGPRPFFGSDLTPTTRARMITLHNFIVSNYFPDHVIVLYITELVSNYFLGSVISCVVAKHTMWTSAYITELFSSSFIGYVI